MDNRYRRSVKIWRYTSTHMQACPYKLFSTKFRLFEHTLHRYRNTTNLACTDTSLCFSTQPSILRYNPHFLSYVTILAALAIRNRSRFSHHRWVRKKGGVEEKGSARRGTCYELFPCRSGRLPCAFFFGRRRRGRVRRKVGETVERVARFQAFPFPSPVSPSRVAWHGFSEVHLPIVLASAAFSLGFEGSTNLRNCSRVNSLSPPPPFVRLQSKQRKRERENNRI